MDVQYVPNRFNKQDYHLLYNIATTFTIKRLLYHAAYRDKRVQRAICGSGFDIQTIFYCDFDEIPLYMNTNTANSQIVQEIAKWRLSINK